MPAGVPYNTAVHDSTDPSANPILVAKTSGQIGITQTIQNPTYEENSAKVIGKEVKGGHWVEYFSQLTQRNGAALLSAVVEEGMSVYVRYFDDGSACKKAYRLLDYPGTNQSDWEEVGGTNTVVISNVSNVADLAARNAIPELDRDFVNVADARTTSNITGISQANPAVVSVDDIGDILNGSILTISSVGGMTEIPDGTYRATNITPLSFELQTAESVNVDSTGYTAFTNGGTCQLQAPFPRSYVYDSSTSQWSTIYPVGNVDASHVNQNSLYRHAQNTDQKLDEGGPDEVSAQTIRDHIQNQAKHVQINDAANDTNTTQTLSSAKIHEVAQSKVDAADPYSKAEVNAIVQGAKASDASEANKGIAEEATIQETKDGTESGTTSRLFVNPGKLAAWWSWIKTQAQTISSKWTFTAAPAMTWGTITGGQVLHRDPQGNLYFKTVDVNDQVLIQANNQLTQTTLTLNFDDYHYYQTELQSNISALSLSGGSQGKTYFLELTQDTEAGRLFAIPALASSDPVNTAEQRIVEGKIYEATEAFTSTPSTFATELSNDKWTLLAHFADGVLPVLSDTTGKHDMLQLLKRHDGTFLITHIPEY